MSGGVKGCLGCAAIFFGLPILCGAFKICVMEWDRFSAQREVKKAQAIENAKLAEARRQQEVAVVKAKKEEAAARQRQQAKEDKIRTFALKDAPTVWNVYQSLKGEIDIQGRKIDELRETLTSFGRDPNQDSDFQRIMALRDEMIKSLNALHDKLEDAYIAARKYEAAPSRKDYQELHKKALEDGVKEADAATARFKEMRLNK